MKKTKILSMKNDYVFKRILSYRGKEKRLASFISAVTGIEVEKVEIYHDFALEKDSIKQKLGILDIMAKINDDTVVNIEMQNHNVGDIILRELYYACKLITLNLKSGENYDELPNIISIGVLNYDTPELDRYKKKIMLMDSKTLEVYDELQMYFIVLPKARKVFGNIEKPLREWIGFIDGIEREELMKLIKDNKVLLEAYEELEQMSQDETEKLRAFSREKWVRDAIALESKGKKEGKKEGIKEGQIEIAKKLIARGILSIDEIAEDTKLSKEEIKKLAKVS